MHKERFLLTHKGNSANTITSMCYTLDIMEGKQEHPRIR